MLRLTRHPWVTCLLGWVALTCTGSGVPGQTPPRPGMSQQQLNNLPAASRLSMPIGTSGINSFAGSGIYGNGALTGGTSANVNSNPYSAGSLGNNPYGSGTGQNQYSSGYGTYYEDPTGAYLKGAGQVIDSQGRLMLTQQQASVLREKVHADRLANRRKSLDDYLYERSKRPSAEDERQLAQREQLNRSLNNPPVTEIWSGKALNDILADFLVRPARGETANLSTVALPLDKDCLKHINVNRGAGNSALVKNEGRLAWPVAFAGPEYKDERELLTLRAQQAVRQAAFNGQVDPLTVRQITDDTDKLGQRLRRDGKDMPISQYIEAKGFLNDLDAAITVLQQPDVGRHFGGQYTLSATTVPELVKQMTERGLHFAPAIAGDEAAYMALHRWLAEYHQAARMQTAAR
jgi:hypothetical protein